ncbi:hypothetical protein OHB41_47760 [Streptomyces sp. NBC_01571]|uniref:hypothetical protein n=1 Tax=Streptomyces sp. NBC_01571 TaxID=2975883 RepID=UPI002253795A|nr:hypothetical protein [Streptomyces sp. NBC_01571]MCX4580690.1 hypothetical protein [Streptomyces sp. NBC_01571]
MSAASNRSKADKDPSTWMPPSRQLPLPVPHRLGHRQTRYRLTVDPTEQAVLAEGLARCPDLPIHVTLAR